VRYKDGACYIDAYTGAHVCSDDVAIGFALDPARNIPGSLALAAQACMKGTEFNLLVETLEYYDELNLVVAVRRGTIQDLSALVAGIPAGRMVFYFVNTLNMTLIRENEPWTMAPPPAVLSGTGVLCPALRFLPSLGTFFAHSGAAFFQVLALSCWFGINAFLMRSTGPALRPQSLGQPVRLSRDCPRARRHRLPEPGLAPLLPRGLRHGPL
jgi:hypothetical protein